jgi:WD40 repeat protein
MAFSPDGRRLVLGGWLRDGATGRRLRNLEIERGRYLVGGPPKRWFFCGSERLVSLEGGEHVWATEDGRRLAERRDRHHWHQEATAFSADGRRYAVGHKDGSTAEVMDADTGAVLARVEAVVASGLSCLALSPDGQWLAGGTEGGEVEVWSAVDGRHVITLRGHGRPVSDMALSLDGRRLASAGDDEALRLWEIPGGRAVAVRPLDDRDPTYVRYTGGGGSTTHRYWSATPDAVRALSGWEGFVGPPPGPFSVEVHGVVTAFTHRATGRIAAVFPLEGPWLMHPAGMSWVSPSAHVTFVAASEQSI